MIEVGTINRTSILLHKIEKEVVVLVGKKYKLSGAFLFSKWYWHNYLKYSKLYDKYAEDLFKLGKARIPNANQEALSNILLLEQGLLFGLAVYKRKDDYIIPLLQAKNIKSEIKWKTYTSNSIKTFITNGVKDDVEERYIRICQNIVDPVKEYGANHKYLNRMIHFNKALHKQGNILLNINGDIV